MTLRKWIEFNQPVMKIVEFALHVRKKDKEECRDIVESSRIRVEDALEFFGELELIDVSIHNTGHYYMYQLIVIKDDQEKEKENKDERGISLECQR